ncbi:hypothetical protein D3C85_936120 [compost metagenome]
MQAAFHFPEGFGFEQGALGRVGIQLAEVALDQPLAVHQPGLPQAFHRIVGLAGLDHAAQVDEVLQGPFAQLHHAAFHGQVAVEVAQPANARALEIPLQAGGQVTEVVADSQGAAAVITGLGLQQASDVGDAAPHRAFGTQLLDEQFRRRPMGHAALGRAQAEHVVEGCGVAQRPHHVAAVGHRQHAQGQGHGGAAAAAAGTQAWVIGVAGGAEHVVVALRAQAEFRHVGLADKDCAAGPHARHTDGVVLGHLFGEQRRAHRGADAGGGGQILHGLGHAVHPAQPLAAGQLSVALVGLGQQLLGRLQGHDRVDLGVVAFDLRQIRLHHFAAGKLTRTDGF